MEELEHKHLHLLQGRKIHGWADGRRTLRRIDGLISPLACSLPPGPDTDLVRSDLNFPAVTRPLRGGGGDGDGPPSLPPSPIPNLEA